MAEQPMGETLSFDDAQILGLESDAIKGHTGKLVVLAPNERGHALAAESLRQRVAERLPDLPRLRQRVEMPKRGLPSWVDDPGVDLDWHVAAGVDDPVDEETFRRMAGEILAERLDHSRPLWRLDLIPLEGNRTGMVGRIHHAMADGVSAIRTAGAMLFDQGSQEPQARSIPERRPEAGATNAGRAQAAPPGGEAEHRSLMRDLPGALKRELRPGADTVLDQHIGSEREIAWVAFPLTRLKELGHRAGEGITLNDVVLAVVAGGLRRWLGDGGPASLKAQVPVCLHLRDADPAIGNRDSFLNVDLPLDEPDPVARLRSINEETSERKLDHDADTLYAFFHALGRFRPLYKGVTRVISGPREFALSVSNVPGPPERPSILGHEVREFCTFAEPADRHALRVAVVSLGGDLAFGLCSDPDAIDGLDRLAEALEESVGELEEAVEGAA